MIVLFPYKGSLGDGMGQAEESYLANHSTGDLSIQNVSSNAEMLRIMSTTIQQSLFIKTEDNKK